MTNPAEDIAIDFETRSIVDLKACGAHAYARHPSTTPLCMAYRLPGETEPRLWKRGEPCPEAILDHVAVGGRLRAWNAFGFEALIWQHVCHERMGWPKLPIEAWVCSMQEARVAGLPGFLDKAASALRISQQKDTRGKKLISLCCVGWKDAETGAHRWSDAPADLQALGEYCVQDVRVESAIADAIPRLPEAERRLAILDAKINARGVGVDLPLVSVLTWATEEAKADLDRRMAKVTAGAVPTTTALPKLKAWLAEFGVRDEDESLSKDDLGTLLDGDLPPQVRDALLIRQMAAKSSTAKLAAMMAYGATQGGGQRMRGLLSYYGADTGRWAGRGMQPQNLPRASFADPEPVIALLRELHVMGHGAGSPEWAIFEAHVGPMFEVVSKLLRSCVVPGKGNVLDACDLSGIESRVLAWLAGEAWKLKLFREGGDVYLTAASSIYGRKVTKDDKAERLVGKVAELACGYQGAVGAFASMGKNYGVKLPEEEVIAAVRGWRAAHPETVRFWYELNDAAIDATAEPGREFVVRGRIRFMYTGSHLWCRLPSGRALVYRRATVRERQRERKDGTKWTERYVAYFDGWSWVDLYGGLLAENITQATARDVLVAGMWEAEKRGLRIVLHVHDELVVERPADDATAPDRLLAAMLEGPRSQPWTAGLPLDAECDAGLARYRK